MTDPTAPDGSLGNPLPRRAARVLVVDAKGKVLLLRGFDPGEPQDKYWFTVGGGLDEGETPAQGALRELREETGLDIGPDRLEGPVWHQTADIPFNGKWYRQDQEFFAVRVQSLQVTFAGHDPDEQATIDAHRWWSVDDLLATDERFYPVELPTVVTNILGS